MSTSTSNMIRIRAFTLNDVEWARKIWEKHYHLDFDFPDFMRNFYCAFAVEDNSGNPILAGGIRPIPELIAITDKEFSTRTRREALYKLLDGSRYVAERSGHEHIHCFIQDEQWLEVMLKRDFRYTKGMSLVTDVS